MQQKFVFFSVNLEIYIYIYVHSCINSAHIVLVFVPHFPEIKDHQMTKLHFIFLSFQFKQKKMNIALQQKFVAFVSELKIYIYIFSHSCIHSAHIVLDFLYTFHFPEIKDHQMTKMLIIYVYFQF